MLPNTKSHFDRFVAGFNKIAGDEPVYVSFSNAAFWVYGSELAILRLADSYQCGVNDRVSKGVSDEGQFYFKLESSNFVGEFAEGDSRLVGGVSLLSAVEVLTWKSSACDLAAVVASVANGQLSPTQLRLKIL